MVIKMMHFLDKRVNVICEELKRLKVKQKFEIDNWKYKEGNFILSLIHI